MKEDAYKNFDFLDNISEDMPLGCWSIQSDCSKTIVNKCFYFKGYFEKFDVDWVCGVSQSKF